MARKKDFMGRISKEDYRRADEMYGAKMPVRGEDITEEELKRRILQEKNKAAVQKIEDELRYQDELDFREAQRKALQREYKRRGF